MNRPLFGPAAVLIAAALLLDGAWAGPASAGPPAQDRETALGHPIEAGEAPRCPVTRGVFVREEDKARFVADHYGVNINAKYGEVNEVLSGLLNGRRAYLI